MNLEEARLFFTSFGCSHFHMAREYPDRYEEYQKIRISENQENLWKKEYLDSEYSLLLNLKDDREISNKIFNISDIIENGFANSDSLKLLYNAIMLKKDIVDSFTKLLIAESILRVFKNNKDQNCLSQFKKLALEISKDVIDNPIHFSRSTKSEGYLRHGDTLSDGKIKERANCVIKAFQKK